MLKKTLLGTALAMALTVPALAPAAAQDVAPDMAGRSSVDQKNVQTPETVPAGRSMGGPSGDALAKPADPNRQPTGPSSNARPEDRGTNAANTQTGTAQAQGGTPPMAQRPAGAGQGKDEQAQQKAQAGQGGQGQGGQGAQAQADKPVERVPGRGDTQAAGRTNAGAGITTPVEMNKDQPRTVAGTVGGGRPAADQVRGSELQDFSVVGRDGKEIGSVADIVINYKTGKVDSLSVSAGGFAGVGDKVYGIAWDKVQSVDQNGERVQLSVNEDELRPNPDFAERPQSGNTNTR